MIPAFGNYTTRITHYDGTPFPELYGKTVELNGIKYPGLKLGSGNPGDKELQLGVRINLVGKSTDGKTARLDINAQ